MNSFYSHDFQEFTIYQTPVLWESYRGYNYILAKGHEAVVFDPGEFSPIANTINKNQLKVKAIYLTHHHHDHVGAVLELKEKWQCPVFGFINDQERLPGLTQTFKENEKLNILGLQTEVLFLPGHTLGLCLFYFKEKKWLFSSDLIFSLGCGRVFEGTSKQMFESLEKTCSLPNETLLMCSHEYTLANLNFALSIFKDDPKLLSLINSLKQKGQDKEPTVPTTLGFEKEHNPFLRWNETHIRETMNMKNHENWEVFAKIRKLKDQS